MIEKLNKTKIFQLRFGAYKSVLGRCEIYVCNIFDEIPTKASVSPPSPIKNIDTPASITSAAGSSRTFTPSTPNVADPLDVDQSQIQTPASQQDTSPQKDTFHDSCHRQSKRALTFNDVEPHDSTQLPHPKPFNEDSSKEHLYKDDDNPAPQLSKKQRLSVSSPEKETN
nr:uncharacterized protein LOC118034965 [Populus alba]